MRGVAGLQAPNNYMESYKPLSSNDNNYMESYKSISGNDDGVGGEDGLDISNYKTGRGGKSGGVGKSGRVGKNKSGFVGKESKGEWNEEEGRN